MKSFFQKLLLSTPLRPGVAILFSFLVGYFGLFLPSGYLHVTYTEDSKTYELDIPVHGKISGWLDVNYCSVTNANWLVKPNWFFKVDWINVLIIWLIMLWLRYLQKHFPPTLQRLWLFFITTVVCAFVPIFIMLWLTPNSLDCPKEITATVYAITVNWFTVFVWMLGLLLGIYAFIKQGVMSKPEIV